MKENKTYQIKLFIYFAIILVCSASCKKFLEEKPSKNAGIIITTTSDLNAILNEYRNFFEVKNNISLFGTDDNGLSTSLYISQPNAFSAGIVQFSCWDTNFLPQTDQASDFSGTNLWSGEYAKIYIANTVLDNLDRVSGTETEKASIRADAHFIRAYSYWQLANSYCLPFTEANRNEPGLPLKTEPTYDIVPRSTLGETYQQILVDLNEALKTNVPLIQGGVNRIQRANSAAVNAFAARYYLSLNDYPNALKYANISLTEYNTLVDYKTGMRFGVPATININANTPNQQSITINFPYTRDRSLNDPIDVFGWKELLYYRLLTNESNWFIPSQDLLNLYDKDNDLRYKYHMVQNYSYTRGLTSPALSYPGYVFFSSNAIIDGPSTAEMYLVKAECLARTGDFNNAMVTLNQLYSKRTLPNTPGLTATSQIQAINVILQERRRELPFSQRWFDIRRFNTNDNQSDDVPLLSRTFYPYTQFSVMSSQPPKLYSLAKDSRRFASPIPQRDVNLSNGLIKQNTY